jgi:SAM-dependent methyltransferase
MHASALENMQCCIEKYAFLDESDTVGTVVDVGATDVNGSFRSLFSGYPVTYVGVDLQAGPGVDLVAADPYHLPLPSGHADIVVSGQMLEHSEFFWLAFAEMVRVLKPNGLLFLVVPSSGPIHRYPVDCYRFHPDAMSALAKLTAVHLVECWRDDRGPWNDVVGVFSPRPIPSRREPQRAPAVPQSLLAQASSLDLAQEETRGEVPTIEVLAQLHDILQPDPYLEIGVRHGESLRCAKLGAVAVDPWPAVTQPLGGGVRFYRETSDWFFTLHAAECLPEGPDLAFIDGMHHVEFALRDFMNVEKHSHPATVVVFDDVFPNHDAQATRERQTRVWAGDVWKILPCLIRHRPDLVLIPIDSRPTGLLLAAGLNRENRILRDCYNPLVRELQEAPASLPANILGRRNSFQRLDRTIVGFLNELRTARDVTQRAAAVRRVCDAWIAEHQAKGDAF